MKELRRIIMAVVFLVALIVVSLLAVNIFQNSSQDTANNTPPQSSPQNTSSNAQLNNAGYLGESKLFLVSVNVSYGVYSPIAPWLGGVDGGQECFVITATIRSDYSSEELQLLGNHAGRVYFSVSATLYERTSQISAKDVTGAITGYMTPPLGVPQHSLYCDENDTVEIYIATNNRNIDNYAINLKAIELSGRPIP